MGKERDCMDWGVAINIFISGVIVVMVVMAFLQVSVQLTSMIVRRLEKSNQAKQAAAQNNGGKSI